MLANIIQSAKLDLGEKNVVPILMGSPLTEFGLKCAKEQAIKVLSNNLTDKNYYEIDFTLVISPYDLGIGLSLVTPMTLKELSININLEKDEWYILAGYSSYVGYKKILLYSEGD